VAEDLMEDGTISRMSNAYILTEEGRRLPPRSEVEELQFLIVIEIEM
jgi:predicted transcriptional regulator